MLFLIFAVGLSQIEVPAMPSSSKTVPLTSQSKARAAPPAGLVYADAERFVDKQGIEVIRNRAVKVTVPATEKKEGGMQGAHAVEQLKHQTVAKPQSSEGEAIDAKMQISKQQQQERDNERLQILQQELNTEINAWQIKSKTLTVPNAKNTVNAQMLAQLQDAIHEHEQNIRMLQSEIKNLKKTL